MSSSLLEQACQALLEAGTAGALTAGGQQHDTNRTHTQTPNKGKRSTHDGQTSSEAAEGGGRVSPVRPRLRLLSGALLCVWLFGLLLRYGVSGGGYSGAGGPPSSPLFGDFEAQRHWMEVTLNLPLSEWYEGRHVDNNLQYWGLDYPPLTAYVSYVCGWVARHVAGVPELVELGASRGHESPSGKLFMRLSVLVCDALLFLPAVMLALRSITRTSPPAATAASTSVSASPIPSTPTTPPALSLCYMLLAVLSPSFLLIDHGHFQYNCVSLGLVALAVWILWGADDERGGSDSSSGWGWRELGASVAFTLSLTFKQMSLYYAPAFFAYLLAGTRRGKGGKRVPWATTLLRFTLLGLVVLLTLGLVFLPWLLPVSVSVPSAEPSSAASSSSEGKLERTWPLLQVLSRIFPFARGLYEDKVANAWCASSLLIKWHLRFARESMVRAALGATGLAMAPFGLGVFFRPSRVGFLYALAGSSLSFFLFSFQVHEKSFLLPLLPLGILLAPRHPLLSAWAGAIGAFSMAPLLRRDGQGINYLAMQGLFIGVAMPFARAQLIRAAQAAAAASTPAATPSIHLNFAARIVQRANKYPMLMYRLVQLSLLGGAVVHVVAELLPPSARYPDLPLMLVVLYSAAHFVAFYFIVLINHWAMPSSDTEDEQLRPVPLTATQAGDRARALDSKQRKEQ